MDGDFIRRRITELRHSKRLSEYQLSLELGQCKSYIQGITSGKSLPSMQQLFKICRYFHITPAQFFDEGDEYTPLYLQTYPPDCVSAAVHFRDIAPACSSHLPLPA